MNVRSESLSRVALANAPAFDLRAIRADFPILSERVHGKPTQSVELTGADGGPVTVTNTWRFGDREIQFK